MADVTAVKLPTNIDKAEFAKNLSSEIINKYEKRLIYNIAKNEYSHFDRQKRERLYEIALRNASPTEGEIMNTIHYNRRLALIEESLEKYFEENDSVILDGFINFRLEEYKEELYELCSAAEDELAATEEYEEFLEMLRFFVSVQSPREEIVHIINRNDEIRILNKRKRDITDLYCAELKWMDGELTNEDIVLSALVSIAPKKILIHDKETSHQIYQTIREIFCDVNFK